MIIQENLFDLTKEQESTSMMMYNKIVKCLVAPYHTYSQLEKVIPYSPTTYLFPERELSISQIKSFISLIANNPSTDEVRIVTVNQNIILDMVDSCVRVLTEYDEILSSPCKTFQANIHTIRYDLLENKAHKKSKENQTIGINSVNKLIKTINDINEKNKISKEEYNNIHNQINIIGEELISNRLNSMLLDKIEYILKDDSLIEKAIIELAHKTKKPDEYIILATRLVELYRSNNMTDEEIIKKLYN